MADKPTPSLQGIAPELRNRIYGYVLVNEEPINVTQTRNRPQPPLLRTCRQLRSEAATIYYNINTFKYKVCGYNIRPVLPFCKILAKYRKEGKGNAVELLTCEQIVWPMTTTPLNDWLKAYHANPDLVPAPAQDSLDGDMTVRFFGIVDGLRTRTWEQVRGVLEPFYYSMQAGGGDTPPSCGEWWGDGNAHDHEMDDSDGEADDELLLSTLRHFDKDASGPPKTENEKMIMRLMYGRKV